MKLLLPDPRLVLTAAATAAAASLALALSTPATISLDGQRLASDVAPVTAPDGTYLPLRVVAEAAGAQTVVDPGTGAIVVRRGTDVLVLHVGDLRAKLDGHPITLAHAPFTVRGRTMVAAATIARTFGSTVRFDAKHNRVAVRTPGVVVAGAADDEP
ncbi:MAG: copper amine oxidase N-terminal domain-containing protein [Candidatus Eremiobacteraeota bacterium]|nr:copper amine oxidase N-terminal domain-containing protein [Candidatus Eremiobacteraeota bacterium]